MLSAAFAGTGFLSPRLAIDFQDDPAVERAGFHPSVGGFRLVERQQIDDYLAQSLSERLERRLERRADDLRMGGEIGSRIEA